MNFNELGLTFWSLLSYFLFHQRTKESSVVDRKFAGMFDRPSSWVGAAHNCLIAITGSIAKRQCFTIELDTEHRGKSTLAPVPGNKKADGKTIGLSFFEVFLGGFGRARLRESEATAELTVPKFGKSLNSVSQRCEALCSETRQEFRSFCRRSRKS